MIKPEDMQVVVLMGGLGTRLKEFTADTPKSLVEVEGRPFFDYQLDLMQLWGFRKFVFLIGYRANMIEDHYGDGSDRGISIQYCYDGDADFSCNNIVSDQSKIDHCEGENRC